ncbi:2-methylisocitrate lyase-like PEP mutase family enzyme [Kitasatospora gansuensis]|uniref:2-methylisocitrate lyase-like PEP mutase family enzyme n=1 Tax=Kitasatospora gansuensis TaxID=258050 RepID=A0A7W7WFB4_9ACTN|nr:cytochrome P450 [Kitasatospora gansuensis]MBB4945091.1 2-methylisocitrate lyase-like PEP mutase family enzyme [Kitasatospora gansuensis]
MNSTEHRFDRYTDVRAALADPHLGPLPAESGPVGTMAWLRATVARFSSGAEHARRRALVQAELARLDPAALRRSAAAGPEGDARVLAVRALAEVMGLAEPDAVAAAVGTAARTYFGGADPAADAAVAWLLPRVGGADRETAAQRIGLLLQAFEATGTLVDNTRTAPAGSGSVRALLTETLRHDPPVRVMRRVAVRPTLVAGVPVAEGDLVLLELAAANRDPGLFAEPDRFDPLRSGPSALTFGGAPRRCPGREQALALAAGILAPQQEVEPCEAFAALHRAGAPLLLPNAWDHASAALFAERGFPAIGTTSLGVAAASGLPDGTGATRAETLRLARRLGGGAFLLSVDVEGGFSEDPDEVAELARELAAAGAVGINLEDGRADGTLAPVGLHAAKIAAVKAAVPGLFVNARTDTHWLGGRQAETVQRLDAYQLAGADGVFVPGLTERAEIAAVLAGIDVPLNVLHSPNGLTLPELAELGVSRVSLGSLLYRAALGAALGVLDDVRAGRPVRAEVPSYDRVAGLAELS